MMLTDNRKPAWFFYPGWVASSAISIPIAWTIAWVIISQIKQAVSGTIQVAGQTRITEDFVSGYVFLPVLGLLIGILQYLLLRPYLPRMGLWIAATVLGWVLPLLVLYLSSAGLFAAAGVDPAWSGAVGLAIIGASIGLCQWLVLRRRIDRGALWILVNVLGWGVAGLVTGEVISSQLDVIAIALLPPSAASIGWWLLLDKLPPQKGKGGDTVTGNSIAG